jgi:hypothetical protein
MASSARLNVVRKPLWIIGMKSPSMIVFKF